MGIVLFAKFMVVVLFMVVVVLFLVFDSGSIELEVVKVADSAVLTCALRNVRHRVVWVPL